MEGGSRVTVPKTDLSLVWYLCVGVSHSVYSKHILAAHHQRCLQGKVEEKLFLCGDWIKIVCSAHAVEGT